MGILVSIIIPTYNAEKYMKDCIDSIVKQTYTDYEIVIVDGKSEDGTLAIIHNTYKYPNITIVSEKDKGIYDAMNKGIELAKGQFLYFMGADDQLYNSQVLSSIFSDNQSYTYDFIYGNVIIRSTNLCYAGHFNKLKLFEKNICHQSIFYKKSIFDHTGGFEPNYTSLADWVMNMKCFANNTIKIKYTNSIIAYFTDNGFSSQNTDLSYSKNRLFLEQQYFPRYIRFMYQNRKNYLVRLIKWSFYTPLSKRIKI